MIPEQLCIIDAFSKDFHGIILAFSLVLSLLSVKVIKEVQKHPRLHLNGSLDFLKNKNTVGKESWNFVQTLTLTPPYSQ